MFTGEQEADTTDPFSMFEQGFFDQPGGGVQVFFGGGAGDAEVATYFFEGHFMLGVVFKDQPSLIRHVAEGQLGGLVVFFESEVGFRIGWQEGSGGHFMPEVFLVFFVFPDDVDDAVAGHL